MRELERDSSQDASAAAAEPACTRVAVVGRGRLGTALTAALADAGYAVDGPLGRGADGAGDDAVLLCVPDQEIANAAAAIRPGPPVGHCSGATGLEPLAPHEAFSLHPLMTVTRHGATFTGAGAAVAGTTPRALGLATRLATDLGMDPVEIADADRAAYHAAASIASNFLVTLEAAAERLASEVGVERRLLVPLVRATVENWAALGGRQALTGPIARGDQATVDRQRAAIEDRTPELLNLFEALVEATRRACGRREGATTGMRTLRTVSELRAALAEPRREGHSIGLVPTMGAFHEGHLSLIRQARADCDAVVVSLFVNPTQFNDQGDLRSYPRDEARDAALAAESGADILFVPPVEEVYPPGFATTVSVAGLTEVLEGAHRGRQHFDGVTTVVTKLFNMASPEVAYFGQKDAQQARVIERMVRDLDIPVRIEVCPTVREPDGLALSSRNIHLSDDERERASALHRALDAARTAIAEGERDAAAARAKAIAELTAAGLEPEYLELVAAEDLTPVQQINGNLLAIAAARIGETRLIDNELIQQPLSTARPRAAAGNTNNGRP